MDYREIEPSSKSYIFIGGLIYDKSVIINQLFAVPMLIIRSYCLKWVYPTKTIKTP